jgi:hypothetical protein
LIGGRNAERHARTTLREAHEGFAGQASPFKAEGGTF